MSDDGDRIHQLEMELGVVRARLKSEQAERLALWPKAELADKYLTLLRRSRDAIRRVRKSLVGADLVAADLLLADIARLVDIVSGRGDREQHANQPCFACGEMAGVTQAPEGRFLRCNTCGYAG